MNPRGRTVFTVSNHMKKYAGLRLIAVEVKDKKPHDNKFEN